MAQINQALRVKSCWGVGHIEVMDNSPTPKNKPAPTAPTASRSGPPTHDEIFAQAAQECIERLAAKKAHEKDIATGPAPVMPLKNDDIDETLKIIDAFDEWLKNVEAFEAAASNISHQVLRDIQNMDAGTARHLDVDHKDRLMVVWHDGVYESEALVSEIMSRRELETTLDIADDLGCDLAAVRAAYLASMHYCRAMRDWAKGNPFKATPFWEAP